MPYRYDEFDQLEAILEAEASGHPINGNEATLLARRIAERYPDISATMHLMMQRMEFHPGTVAT